MIVFQYVAAVIVGYILGSIPFGLLVAKSTAKVDVRAYGSGKTGATNVLRTAGKKAAAMVGAMDIMKGALAVVFAGLIVGKSYLVVGNFVATFFGGLIAMCPWVVALFGGQILVLGAGLTGFVSLGSIAGVVGTYAILVPLTVLNGFPIEYLIYALIGTFMIIIMHRGNIVRLLRGKERRLGEKAEELQVPPS